MIDMLLNSLFAKKNKPQQSIKRPIPIPQLPVFVHGLSFLLNNHFLVTCISQPGEIGFTIGKFIKVLLNLFLFIDRKGAYIN